MNGADRQGRRAAASTWPGAVLFYGGLAAEVLLFAGIGEQLVARLAARFRLVSTSPNLNVATSGGFLTALDSGVARPLVESRTALAATAAAAVSSTDVPGHAGICSGSKPQATRWHPAWCCSSRPASRGAPLAAAGWIVAALLRQVPAKPNRGRWAPARPARPGLKLSAGMKMPKRLRFTGPRPSSTATASTCPARRQAPRSGRPGHVPDRRRRGCFGECWCGCCPLGGVEAAASEDQPGVSGPVAGAVAVVRLVRVVRPAAR